jgi:hypothetical protein
VTLPTARLAAAIRDAVRLLETGRPDAARDLLRRLVPCPPPAFDAPTLPEREEG